MPLKYGYEAKDWQALKDEIVEIVGARIRAGEGTITYGQLCAAMKTIEIHPHDFALVGLFGARNGAAS